MKERFKRWLLILIVFIGVATVSADLQIRKNISDSIVYIKNLVLTDTGLPDGSIKISLDGTNWSINSQSYISWLQMCLSWSCLSSWSGAWTNYWTEYWSVLVYPWWIRLSDYSTTCDSSVVGSIRYNSSTNTFEWCSWSSPAWKDISVASPVYTERVSASWWSWLISLSCNLWEKLVNAWVEYESVHSWWYYTIWWDVWVNHSTVTAKTDCAWSNCKLHIYCVLY